MRFRSSPIFLVYLVAFLDLFSASMIVVTLPVFLKSELGMSASLAGLVNSLYGFVQFFSSPLIGGWSDTAGFKHVTVLCVLLCVPCYAGLTSFNWAVVILARLGAGCFKHTQNLSRAFLASYTHENEQVCAYGRLNAMGNVGYIAGPAVSGLVLRYYGYKAVFLLVCLVFILNALIIHLFLPNDETEWAKVSKNNNNNNEEENGLLNNGHPPTLHPLKVTLHQDFSTLHYHDSSNLLQQQNNVVPKSLKNLQKRANFAKNSLSALFREIRQVDWSKHWDVFFTRFLLSFVILMYRGSYNWMLTDRYNLDPTSQNYLSSFQGVVSFFTSYFINKLYRFYNGDLLKINKHAILLILVAMVGLVLSRDFLMYANFLALLCAGTSILRVVSLNLTSARCSNHEHGLVLGASASVTSLARCWGPFLSGLLHDTHIDGPGILGIFMILIGYGVTKCVTDVVHNKLVVDSSN